MKRSLLTLLLLVSACSSAGSDTTTTSLAAATTSGESVSTTAPPVECPSPPYQVSFLPAGVGAAVLDPAEIEPDVWTSVPGSSATLWGQGEEVAIALVRGSLPAVDWPGDKGVVSIDGTDGVVGPHDDGTWVAGWFEAPGERCDLYTMVFYPPVAPEDVEQVILGMNRVGG